MVERLTWTPADNLDSLIFSAESETFLLRRLEGTGQTMASPVSDKGPFQLGETFLTPNIAPRMIIAEVAVLGATVTEHLQLRETMAGSMAAQMGSPLLRSKLGVLMYERPGSLTLFIDALPVNSPSFRREGGPATSVADIEFWCPFPYWRRENDEVVAVDSVGGVTYPLEYELAYTEVIQAARIDNEGSASASPKFTIQGEIVNPVIVNETTSEELEFNVSLAESESLEIDTAFGQKSVVHVDALGERTDAFDTLVLDNAVFFQLPRGITDFTLTGDPDVSGALLVSWRELVGGV